MRPGFSVLLVLLVLDAGLTFAEPLGTASQFPPDPRTGEIEGVPAIMFWPVDEVSGASIELTSCNAFIESHGHGRAALESPCGKWFTVPKGSYDVRLETPDRVSSKTTVFRYGGGPFRGNGTIITVQMADAGLVRLKRNGLADNRSRETFRFISLRPSASLHERQVPTADAEAGIRVPVGRAVAGIFAESGDAIALTRPFFVSGTKPTAVAPVAPSGAADVLVVLERVSGSRVAGAEADLWLEARDLRRSPDVLLDVSDRIVAIWYSTPPGEAEFWGDVDGYSIAPRHFGLYQGRVATIRESIQKEQPGQ